MTTTNPTHRPTEPTEPAGATPGPWHWEMVHETCMALYGPRGEWDHVLWSSICPSCVRRGYRCTAPRDVDAALIAAAPETKRERDELLAAAKVALEWIEHNTTRIEYDHIGEPLRAAIAGCKR